MREITKLELHRCKVCGTRWLLWPDVIHGGGWNLLDKWQRPGSCCDNVAMGDQIEHLRDFELASDRAVKEPGTVTRLEVIDEKGRAFARWGCSVEFSYQDEGRTLKVFVKDNPAVANRPATGWLEPVIALAKSAAEGLIASPASQRTNFDGQTDAEQQREFLPLREDFDPDPMCQRCRGTGECSNAQFRCPCRWTPHGTPADKQEILTEIDEQHARELNAFFAADAAEVSSPARVCEACGQAITLPAPICDSCYSVLASSPARPQLEEMAREIYHRIIEQEYRLRSMQRPWNEERLVPIIAAVLAEGAASSAPPHGGLDHFTSCADCGLTWKGPWADCPGCQLQASVAASSATPALEQKKSEKI